MPDPSRDALISLCERVLSAEITLDELERAWPEPVESAGLASLRETLEDAIEHTPADPRPGRTPPEYDDVRFYLGRLREASD